MMHVALLCTVVILGARKSHFKINIKKQNVKILLSYNMFLNSNIRFHNHTYVYFCLVHNNHGYLHRSTAHNYTLYHYKLIKLKTIKTGKVIDNKL